MVDFNALKAPFEPSKVSWRVGSIAKSTWDEKTGGKATALAYLDARDVMDRLDDVCGPAGWQCRYSHAEGKTVCDIGIMAMHPTIGTFEWIWKADGAGDSDIEAEKGALSDAFKRAGVRWGIGRYLYDIKTPWVKVDKWKKIEENEYERLATLLPNAGPSLKFLAPSGLAKTPGKFWSGASLLIPLKKEYADEAIKDGKWSSEAWEWWIDKFKEAIEKAPDRELLAKFQSDNQHILDQLPAEETFRFCEMCSVRAEQFKEYA